MSTLSIVPLTEALTHPGLQIARLPKQWLHHDDLLFVVLTPGFFEDRLLQAGDLLVCRGHIDEGDSVVITPRGRGTARLATVDGTAVRGTSGEPCSASRWQVAGRLFAVVPSDASVLPRRVPVQLGSAPKAAPATSHLRSWRAIARKAQTVTEPTRRRQLSLFTRKAA